MVVPQRPERKPASGGGSLECDPTDPDGGDMRLERVELERATEPDTDIQDLTDDVRAAVTQSGIRDGSVLVFTPGSTAGVTAIEFEPGAVADLARALDRMAPTEGEYEHNRRWGDGNGYSHVRAALLGPLAHRAGCQRSAGARHVAADRTVRLRQPAAAAPHRRASPRRLRTTRPARRRRPAGRHLLARA